MLRECPLMYRTFNSVLIETKKPVSRLVECGADNVCEQAYALFATDGHMHARVLT